MYANQRGSTLIISLILLLLFTIMGLASVSNISFNQKMSSNYRDADLTFHAAEAVLKEGEDYIEELSAAINGDHFDPSCSDENCFTNNCLAGRCFAGVHSAGNQCFDDEPPAPYAELDATWDEASRARESELNFPGLLERPKYIVEFLCYVSRDPNVVPVEDFAYPPGDWSYFFRVTSYAQGANGTSRVMLQSTYKVDQ